MELDNKITIIEGPPPTFQEVANGWVLGLNEAANLYGLAVTHLRTFNGPALVERCHRTWQRQDVMWLHYRNEIGLEERAPILAARALTTDDGQVLLLWVRRQIEEHETPPPHDSIN
jgi:hypothetical protein